jgi:hypothetical protein
MSLAQVRGGIPHVVRDDLVDDAGRIINLPFYCSHLIIRNQGLNACKLYFTQADFDGDKNYVTVPVPSTTYPYGEWSGMVETAAGNNSDVWVKALALKTTAIELVAFQRRG